MGRKSTVDLLPDELRQKLLNLLKDPSITQKDIVCLINNEAGEDVVSKSSVNRYAKRMEAMIEKTRQAREVADMYLNSVGNDTRNKLGKIVNERVRMLAFDLTDEIMALRESGEEGIDPKQVSEIIQKVSRAVKELEQAEKLNAEREAKIRKEALEEAAAIAEDKMKKAGSGQSLILEMKKEILGQI